MNKTLIKRLATTLKERGMKQSELAQRSGIRASSISDYLNGKYAPKQDKIDLMAKALNVDSAWLMGYDDVPQNSNSTSFNPSSLSNYVAIKKKKIPLIGTIAAGQPIMADEHIEEYIPVEDDIHADYALRIEGDSMINANIYNGDIVFIHQQDDVENGQIAAVLVDDSATLKRVYKMPGYVQLVAENPKYPPMIFNEDNCDTCRILGKAVAVLHEI